ncbi:MAG TPA: carboxypeptidase-like regulatory domain-containing protein, partial [Thermoanaerobaculia bacterium]|nr:carboxypeptidase-like regulatory domain-containing protein [Thermoanaerobaculia bacterium]
EGRADVLPPAPGTSLLIVAEGGAWGEVRAPAKGPPVGGKPIAIRLGPPRKARGRALESISGQPLSNALVWAGGESLALDGVVHPDAQGNFEIAVAGSGKPTFGAAAAGHAWRQMSAAVPGPRDLPILLRLDRSDPEGAAGLTGILIDEAGQPVGGAEIFAVRETESAVGGVRTTNRKEQRLATSDIHGGFHAGSLESGTFDLVARANGFVPGRLPGLQLAAGGRLPALKIVLSRGLGLEGRLRDPEGNPAAGVTVEARKVRPAGKEAAVAWFLPPQSSFVTDRGGQFKLTGLEPGAYEITAKNALGRAHGTVEVGADGGRIDLQLAASTERAVSGVVTDADGHPIAGATVDLIAELKPGFTNTLGTRTAADGTFSLDLPPGEYRLSVTAAGYEMTDPAARVRVGGVPISGLAIRLRAVR